MPSLISTVRTEVRGGHLRLNGEYEFLSTLGEGSFGEVVLARRLVGAPSGGRPGELVAIKCYSRSRLLKRRDIRQEGGKLVVVTALEKVLGEVLALHAVGPGVPGGTACANVLRMRALYASPQSDEFFLVLDYVDGGELMQYSEAEEAFRSKATGGTLGLRTVRQVLRDLAHALHHCHGKGCAHRDVKPDNILMTAHGRLVLCDFGVAGLYRTRGWARLRGLLPAIVALARRQRLAQQGSAEGSSSSSSSSAGAGAPEEPSHPLPTPQSDASTYLANIAATLVRLGFPPIPRPHFTPPDTVKDTAGTVLFLCPEAAEGKPYSATAADLWAVGVLMYILLFGQVPFGRSLKDPTAVFEAIAAAQLPTPLPWDTLALLCGGGSADAPPSSAAALEAAASAAQAQRAAAEDLLRRLLASNPCERISSTGELLAHPFLSSSPVAAAVALGPAAGALGGSSSHSNSSSSSSSSSSSMSRGSALGSSSSEDNSSLRDRFPATDVRMLPLYVTPEMAMDAGSGYWSSEEGVSGGAGSYAGWLLKRSSGGLFSKGWARYFFILTDGGQLSYFGKPPLVTSGVRTPRGPSMSRATFSTSDSRSSSFSAGGGGGGGGGSASSPLLIGSPTRVGASRLGSMALSPSSASTAAAAAAAAAGAAAAATAAAEAAGADAPEYRRRGGFSLKAGGDRAARFRRVAKPDKPWRFMLSAGEEEVYLQAECEGSLLAWEAALRLHCAL